MIWFLAAIAGVIGALLLCSKRSLFRPAPTMPDRPVPTIVRSAGPTQNWIAAADPSVIEGFEAEQETLLFVWDDSETGSAAPSVTLQPDPLDGSHLQILMEGEIIADVSGNAETLSAADISLIPLSSARAIGFAQP